MQMFTKSARATLKQLFSHIKLHHGMSPGNIEIRNELSDIENVKFVRYEGCNRHFTVCMKSKNSSEPDKFYNRIRNVPQLIAETSK